MTMKCCNGYAIVSNGRVAGREEAREQFCHGWFVHCCFNFVLFDEITFPKKWEVIQTTFFFSSCRIRSIYTVFYQCRQKTSTRKYTISTVCIINADCFLLRRLCWYSIYADSWHIYATILIIEFQYHFAVKFYRCQQ